MADKISVVIEATDRISGVLTRIGSGLNTLGEQASRAASSLARIGAGAALGGILALGSGVVGLATSGLSLNNSMEQVTAQLNAFTKDGAKSAQILDMIRDRAAKTPFEFDAMAKAASALLPSAKQANVGLESLIASAEILAASNPAEGLEGAAFALKEAVSGDFTSIVERFNLPRQYINKLKEEGVPALEIVRRAMGELGLDADLVANMANTLSGRWSTFKDTIAGVAAQATKPIFEAMSNGLAGLNTVLEVNAPLLSNLGTQIAGGLSQAISISTALFTQYTPVVSGFIAQFVVGFTQMQTAIGAVIAGIAATVAVFIPQLNATWVAGWTVLQTTTGAVASAIQQYTAGMGEVITAIFTQTQVFIRAHGADVLSFLTTTWQQAGAIVQAAAALMQATVIPSLSAIAGFIRSHGAEIQAVLSTTWTFVSTVVRETLNIIGSAIRLATAVFSGDWKTAWNQLQLITQSTSTIISTTIKTAMLLIESVIRTAVENFQTGWRNGWETMRTIAGQLLDALGNTVNLGIEKARQYIINGIELAMSWMRGKVGDFGGIGGALMDGLRNGIMSKINAIAEAASNVVSNAIAAAKRIAGISSPAKATIEDGGHIGTGYAIGITDAIPEVVSASTSLLTASLNLFDGAAGDYATVFNQIERTTTQMMPVVAQSFSGALDLVDLKTRWFADSFEDQILTAAESFVELAQTGDHSSLLFAQSFEAIRAKINELVPAFGGGQAAMEAMHAAMASGQFDGEAYWQAYFKLLQEIKTSMGISESVVVSTTQAMSNAVTSATQTMQTQASSAAQSIAAAMIAAGQVINTTQQQLAGFIQSGGVGGITGGIYTPSAAFQALFTNPPPAAIIAPPRPASVPKGDTINNTPINITINSNAAVDRYAVEEGTMSALRRAGLTGRFA